MVLELMARKPLDIGIIMEVKILLVGCPGSGKSTLVGVLTSGELDNGRGSSMMRVCAHMHDLLKGSTSSVNSHVIGFSAEGKLVNRESLVSTLESVVLESSKLVSLIDTSGSKVSQLISSLHAFNPEYAFLVVSARAGAHSCE
jgi:GTPase